MSCFSVETPRTILTELPARVRASIAVALELILDLMGLGLCFKKRVGNIEGGRRGGRARVGWGAGRHVHQAARRVWSVFRSSEVAGDVGNELGVL